MRAIATVASCIGVGFVLQGCGGNSEQACLAEKMDVVSQTLSGTTEVSMEVTLNGTTMTTTVTGSFTEMFDFEKFNMREDASGIAEVMGNTTVVNTTQILNIGEKQLIVYTSAVDLKGKPMKTCVIEQLPAETPTPELLSGMFQAEIKPLLQQAAVCGGNDGTYDTWKFNKTFSGKLPPIPNSPDPRLDGLSIKDGSVSEDVQMTKDALLHTSVTHVKGEMLNGTAVLGNLNLTASMTVTDAKAGGPSATDLDPSQFDVTCTPLNTTVDLEAFLQAPGFARQQLLRIMEASKSEDSLMV
jgi:hypothetical protein